MSPQCGLAFRQETLAIDDERKLRKILDDYYGDFDNPAVAVLYEPSPFGRGAFDSLKKLTCIPGETHAAAAGTRKCRKGIGFEFPPNIADLRMQRRENDAESQQKLALLRFSAENKSLPIDEGAENGNEYPEAFDSKLAVVSTEQRLRLQFDALRRQNPGTVIVAASDVRDRLYLLDRLSREFPGVRLFDLEADILLSHPDYLHATRGAFMLASTTLNPEPADDTNTSCQIGKSPPGEILQFDSDRSAMLHTLMRCSVVVQRTTVPLVYTIGREGPIALDESGLKGTSLRNLAILDRSADHALAGVSQDVSILTGIPILVLAAAALWYWLGRPPDFGRSANDPMHAPWWNASPVPRHVVGRYLIILVGLLFLGGLLLLPLLRASANASLGFALMMLLVGISMIAQLAWLALAGQLREWTRYAELLVQSQNGRKGLSEWSTIAGPKPAFVSTPLVAGLTAAPETAGGEVFSTAMARTQLVALEFGFNDSLGLRMALRSLLRPVLRAICGLATVSLACCLTIILMTLLAPLPGRSLPLLCGFALIVTASALLSSQAIQFERNSLLSRLFCSTDGGLQVSVQFLAALLAPLVLVVLSLIVTDQPGVMDTAGGLLKWLTTAK